MLMAIAMVFGASGAWAADPDLENDYTLVRSVEFGDAAAEAIACSGSCAYTAYDTGNKKQQALTIATAPVDAAGWIAFQGWTDGSGKGWWNRADKSLYCVNAGRSAAVFGDDLKTGWLVVFDCKGQATAGLTLTNANGSPDGTFTYSLSEDGKSYYCSITADENAYVGFCGIKNSEGILKISVYKPNKVVVATTFTVKFVNQDGGAELKDPVTHTGFAGQVPSLDGADKANIVVEDKTYLYKSDDAAEQVIAEDGSTVVTAQFGLAQNFNYLVNETCNGQIVRTTSGVDIESANVKVPYRKYNVLEGQLYTKGATNKEYNYSFKLTQDNQTENVAYDAKDGVDNVVFLTEGEDVEGLVACNSANTAIRSSNSSSAYAPQDTKITTLPAGKYKIHAVIYDASKEPNSNWTFMAGDVQAATFNCTTVNIQEFDSDEFVIGKETDIIMVKGGGNTMGLDALYIVKTGDVTPMEAAKEELKKAIAKATALNEFANDADLTQAIATAQAAVDSDEATLLSLMQAGTALEAAAKTAAKNTLQTVVTMTESLGLEDEAITNAKALLTNDEATAEQFAAALQALYEKAIPTAQSALGDAKKFFDTFDSEAATTLASSFAAVEQALLGKNINTMVNTMADLITQAKPAAKNAVDKLIEYFTYLDNETLKADVTALQAAMASEAPNAFLNMIAIAKKGVADFKAAIPAFLAQVNAMETEGKEGAAELNAAIKNLTDALANEEETIPTIALAVRNLINAVKAFIEANATDHYTVVGGFNEEGGIDNVLFGKQWDPSLESNDMELGLDGLWTKTYQNITLEANTTILYKVVKNHSWDEAYGFDGKNADYVIKTSGVAETITFTFNPEAEGNKVSCTVKFADSELMAIARELAADDNAVAVGKLRQALEWAEAGDESALQAAIDQFKADNAPLETDLTSQFSALTDPKNWVNAIGAGTMAYAGGAAPKVHVNGAEVALVESYDQGQEFKLKTGDVMYQDITGLTPGTYGIELFGAACLTPGRAGMTTDFEEGDDNAKVGAYLYAQSGEQTVKEYVPCLIEDDMNHRGGEEAIPTAKLNGVVVGTDGTIRIGLAKQLGLTNWHFVQLKGVTAQVLAKDLFATQQVELKALVAKGNALAADENKTTGKEEFQTVLEAAKKAVASNWYNNAEVKQFIDDLKDAIATFKKANYYIDFAAGAYYVIDAETGLKMAAGHDYGTRGIVNEMGLDLTLTPYSESHTVTFDSRVSNGGNNHFLGKNLYMDSSEWGFALEHLGFGFFNILEPESEKYINLDMDNNLVLSDTPREFIIVSKEGVMETRLEELEEAKKDAPMDATFLLQNPNFNRNDQRVSAWEWAPSQTSEENPDFWNNHNFNGGNGTNNCAESYHAAFTVKQTVEGAPAGFYSMTAQGFYRQDTFEGDTPAAPMFFANGVNMAVPAKTGEEGGMSDASVSFANGLYTIEPIHFEVKEDGMMYVGVTAAVNNQWVIWDNFQLKYYGNEDPTTGISEVNAGMLNAAEGIYNLQGQKVMKAQKGLFIQNGKKVVLK